MTDTAQKKRKWDDDGGRSGSASPPPMSKSSKIESKDNDIDASKAASIAAAKIKAMLAQQEKSDPNATKGFSDGVFVKDIEINDLKNRYMLTKGATQTQIQNETGADVTTRGKYYPDKTNATEKDPPLYLHITAADQESLDKAVSKIEDLIETAQVPLPGTGYPPREPRPERKIHEKRVVVGMESSPHFNLRAKIVGPQGFYVKHIQHETGCRVQLKGRGSGFVEQNTGIEADEPLYVHITSPREEALEKAEQLTNDLIGTVKEEYDRFKQSGPHGRGSGRSQNYDYGGQHYQYPPPPEANANPNGGYDYSQYYAYYGYQYDPNYYYNYGASDPSAQQQPHTPTTPVTGAASTPVTASAPAPYGATPHPPPPPPPEESSSKSADTPPPPPPPPEE